MMIHKWGRVVEPALQLISSSVQQSSNPAIRQSGSRSPAGLWTLANWEPCFSLTRKERHLAGKWIRTGPSLCFTAQDLCLAIRANKLVPFGTERNGTQRIGTKRTWFFVNCTVFLGNLPLISIGCKPSSNITAIGLKFLYSLMLLYQKPCNTRRVKYILEIYP